MNKILCLSFIIVVNIFFPAHASASVQTDKEETVTIKMTINQQTFDVELKNTPAAKAFMEQLPLTLTMEELNGNEKFADLPRPLPASQITPGTINQGDLMLFGRRTLVLFYETFQTSYGYTPVGRITTPENLGKIAGHKEVIATFTADKKV
ncbi:cyclophilin-like fold protein [Enterobacter sp.]|uniref:cyclophilin-like fold protein n=1 Tax=Enterobacter sp. TaxID=42895 RepID=UPI0028FFBFD4|nr:cyclophilin-like fold protein [Enterobacter sp.]MDU1920104.1 cyclophilin-like fold protein [Enterobacter sp.]MDU2002045.1 cyclophilin-like fold protein [Enterobacter hormaechei]MDU2013733.1 cyclophilin-like fold protein [Enterobacter hormaechei]